MTPINLSPATNELCAERIGVAKLTKLAFDSIDLKPLWNELMKEIADPAVGAGAAMDLSVIAQLLGDQKMGLAIQKEVLARKRLYRSPCASAAPRLRLLAFAAAIDMGGNTPLEFLLEDSDVELLTLYIVPGLALPDPLPEHDVAIIAVPDSDETRETLAEIRKLLPQWPRPVFNLPQRIAELDRDRLFNMLNSISELEIPMTARISRDHLCEIGIGKKDVNEVLSDGAFPLIIRPIGSHAGRGLQKLETPSQIEDYLEERVEDEFFISRFVDYRGDDGLHRKYRVVFVDGRPFACHMAISEQWNIWYLNADMTRSAEKRAEEEKFMVEFDEGFAARHRGALAEIVNRVGLEYFAIDCAETKAGKLLVFEADNCAIVHNMDPPEIFPYKAAQMRKIFDAFVAMLYRLAGRAHAHAA
jgi:glutathione synthase/RimK-type ligase-like ATP-grasp enzyme